MAKRINKRTPSLDLIVPAWVDNEPAILPEREVPEPGNDPDVDYRYSVSIEDRRWLKEVGHTPGREGARRLAELLARMGSIAYVHKQYRAERNTWMSFPGPLFVCYPEKRRGAFGHLGKDGGRND